MSKDSAERKLFNSYRDKLIRELGRKATTDAQLDKVGAREFGPAWGGVFAQDEIRLKPNKYYIANTDTAGKKGEHWIAVVTTRNNVYIWDSYGRDTSKIASHINKHAKSTGFGKASTNLVPHGEQIGYTSSICGPLSIAFLLTARDLGIRKASNI